MFDLVRLTYSSKANFDYQPDSPAMEPAVAEILKQSRVNNREANIGGVLYFAEGYFFQCLEGRRSKVMRLVEVVQNDPRHTDFRISFCRRARRRRFNGWTMKYVPVGQEVKTFVESRGYAEFNPTLLLESEVNSLVHLFTQLEDTSLLSPELSVAHRSKPNFWQRMFSGTQLRSV